ncbi:MAG TPA: hypothetical protein VFC15_11130, partial [Candidatus Limnocylindrales bacterium]|nr:hypothetical protein [Candidatus Limnocylindrales bacterium]
NSQLSPNFIQGSGALDRFGSLDFDGQPTSTTTTTRVSNVRIGMPESIIQSSRVDCASRAT